MIVSFDSDGHHNTTGGVWTTKANAITYINGLTSGSGTDYDAALDEVYDNYGSGPTPAGHNLVYFLSDGEPNENGGQRWRKRDVGSISCRSQHRDVICGGYRHRTEPWDLYPIAYPNSPGTEPNAIIMTNAADLSNTISSALPGSASGNVLSNDGFGADGAAGTGLVSITVDGHVYTYVSASNKLQKDGADFAGGSATSTLDVTTTLGGHFKFYFTTASGHVAGDYSYDLPANVSANQTETFSYKISDNDGDPSTSSLSILVTAVNDAPVNTVPGAQSTNEDVSKVLTGLSIADVDAGAGSMTVTLAVAHGTLVVVGGTAAISGSGTATVTLTGTVAAINLTLSAANAVTYVPTADYNSSDTLTMTTSDNGNTGAGG